MSRRSNFTRLEAALIVGVAVTTLAGIVNVALAATAKHVEWFTLAAIGFALVVLGGVAITQLVTASRFRYILQGRRTGGAR